MEAEKIIPQAQYRGFKFKCDQCGKAFDHAPYVSKTDVDVGRLHLCSYSCYLRAIGFLEDDGVAIRGED